MEENVSERWRSSTSAFIDRNAGLLLVAGSEFFFSIINVSIKWLNSLDEPMPILEVCGAAKVILSAESVKHHSVQQIWIRMASSLTAYGILRC
jgi:hypothetical protein